MTTTGDADRLRSVFARPGLARLRARLKRRLEDGATGTTLTLADASEEERQEVASLLGRAPRRGRSISVSVTEVEAVLRRAGLAPDLYTAMETIDGPLRDRQGERAAAEQAWAGVYRSASAECERPGVTVWLEELRRDGLLKRLAAGDPQAAETLLQQALRVLAQLPGDGQTLSTLAATALGDAHALDASRPVATLVRRALRERTPLADDTTAAESERELWASAGIVVGGGLSSTVLTLNLPVSGDSATARMLLAAASAAQPAWLTLRQLLQAPAQWPVHGRRVRICENPAVIAEAADRLREHCPPLVCTNGQSGAAVNHLLGCLRDAGAELLYHGDYDWSGLRIANNIMRRFDAQPWCYDTAAYLRAACNGGMPLDGSPAEATWDPALAPAMHRTGVGVPEERVLDTLWTSLDEDD